MRGEILGYIPQVAHTYAVIEGMYGIMNEHQVAIGESTCAAKLYAAPVGSAGGKALLEASELSQIALERAASAREAIQVMGDLATQYGFYSADWDVSKYGPAHALGEGGEALTVIDKNEAWMFHIIPDDTGTSAVWVAQRVPDDHISAVANSFVIREVVRDHPDFLYSKNLWSVAEKMGWWDESQGNLNFLKTYAPQRYHPNYSNRRVWRVLSLANPDANLPADTNADADDYPFSIKVADDRKFSVEDMMHLQRDHYEGTQYSTAQGIAAGPYGDPNRFDIWASGNMTVWEANEGEFPRTISLFRTSYAFVAQGRSDKVDLLSLVWFCQYAPDISSFTPLYVASESLPLPWIRGAMHHFTSESAWWNFCLVSNYASRFYSFTIKAIRKLQDGIEARAVIGVSQVDAFVNQLLTSGDPGSNRAAIDAMTSFTVESGVRISNEWRDFFPVLVATYRDGYVFKDLDKAAFGFTRMFYPKWWLDLTDYFSKPPNKNGILFSPNSGDQHGQYGLQVDGLTFLASMFVCSLCSAVVTYLIMTKGTWNRGKSNQGLFGPNSRQSSSVRYQAIVELGESRPIVPQQC
jgi:dipeptidase